MVVRGFGVSPNLVCAERERERKWKRLERNIELVTSFFDYPTNYMN